MDHNFENGDLLLIFLAGRQRPQRPNLSQKIPYFWRDLVGLKGPVAENTIEAFSPRFTLKRRTRSLKGVSFQESSMLGRNFEEKSMGDRASILEFWGGPRSA